MQSLATDGKKVAAASPQPPRAARPPRLLDITVLMGGLSSERQVSLATGAAIADALARLGHKVTRADINPHDTSALARKGADLVFIALHGDFGESGQVQEMCQRRGLRYIGSSAEASALAMDKAAAKDVFRKAGLATPDWLVLEAGGARDRKQLEALGLPVVIKPVDGGSSVDICIARDALHRDQAVQAMLVRYGRAMAERFVKGAELTVGILGRQALPVIRIVPARDFYDYTAKYADGAGTQYLFEHGLSDEAVGAVQEAAVKGHQSLGCRDLSRVDFILDKDGIPQLLEINTIPGFTSHSLLPKAAQRAGISFDDLVQRIVDMAMSR